MSNIVVLCVNYHCEEETVRFVKHLATLPGSGDFHVVVVDNEAPCGDLGGKDPFADLRHLELKVDLVSSKENLGYFGGARLGWQHFQSRAADVPDWVIVSNTDIEIIGSMQGLKEAKEIDRDLLVVAPQIVSLKSGSDQNPFMNERPSPTKMNLYRLIFGSYPTSLIYNLAHEGKSWVRSLRSPSIRGSGAGRTLAARAIYAPHGAFLAFHSDYFLRGGTLDYGSFLFYEEIFVAEEVRRLGGKVLYLPSIVVHHREHVTTKAFAQLIPSRRLLKAQAESAAYCYNHYFRSK